MIITITNQKGGVGKTTTAHAMCCCLVNKGYKVLAIDTDPQTNLTYTAGIIPGMIDYDLYDVFKARVSVKDAILHTKAGFDIIPGSLELTAADMEFAQLGREYILKEALEPIQDKYDFIVIDTPPTIGILVSNALTCSNFVLLPMCAEIYSLQGLSRLHKLIESVRKHSNSKLCVDGLLLTKYSQRAIVNRQLRDTIEAAAGQLNTKVYRTPIREAVAVKETQLMQSDIFTEYPTANVTQDYEEFVAEFLEGKID